MGFGGWPESVDRVSIAYDRYLLASGTWTIDDRRWLLMYDLQADKIAFFNRDLPDASTETKFAITADGATILQTNSNGHLYFYNVADEKPVLSGLDIDDELVVYDRHGYYSSTPEGAQFVFVKFPGLSGYNSLHQFSAMLNRPDVIRNILTGKTDTPRPGSQCAPESEPAGASDRFRESPVREGEGRCVLAHRPSALADFRRWPAGRGVSAIGKQWSD
jgi:hypothetical protein